MKTLISSQAKVVLQLAWPALIDMILFQAVAMINLAMVGHLGPSALASVGASNPPLMILLSVFVALNVGTTAMVARYVGANNIDNARETAIQALIVTAIIGMITGISGAFLSHQALALMGTSAKVLEQGTAYLRLMCIGLIFGSFSTCASAILRGSGDTRTPMNINMTTNLLVLVLNMLLIEGRLGLPALGVMGCGVSSIVARLSGAFLFVWAMRRESSIIRIKLTRRLHLRPDIIKPMLNIGIPSACEQFLLQTGLALFARMVVGLGTEAFAAHQIAANILGMSFMPGQAFAMAAATLVGQRLGADAPDEAEAAARQTRRLGFIFSAGMGIIFLAFPQLLIKLFTSNRQVIILATTAVRIIALSQPMQSAQFIIAGGLRGAGDTMVPLYTTAASVWLVRLTSAYILIYMMGLGLVGAWLSFTIDQFCRWSFITLRFNHGLWKRIRVAEV